MIDRIRTAFVKRRFQCCISLRDASDATGVSASTLGRFERGVGTLDVEHLAAVASWAKVPLSEDAVAETSGTDTLTAIHAVIRRDARLDDVAKNALCELMTVSMRHFKARQK